MDVSGVSSNFDFLKQWVDEFAISFNDVGIQIVLDLPTGYALFTCPSIKRPYLVITGNPFSLYLRDLLILEPNGLIAPGGARGREQIEHALQEIRAGRKVYLGPPLNVENGLTAREQVVVRLVATGCGNQEITQITGVTEKTVQNIISSVLSKLELKSRIELGYFYLGFLPIIKGSIPE